MSDLKRARGKCKPLGNACDADRIIGRLEEAADETVCAVVLCDPCFRRTPLWKRKEEAALARGGGEVVLADDAMSRPLAPLGRRRRKP